MSLFARRNAAPKAEQRSFPVSQLLGSADFYATPTAGEDVGLDSALLNIAVGACRRVLVTEVAQLPLHSFSNRGGRRARVADSPVVASPSSQVSRRNWIGQVMDSMARAGNAYMKATNVASDGRLLNVETLAPSMVSWQTKDKVLRPYVAGVEQTLWPLGDFIHVPSTAFILAGSPVSMSPVEIARESISTDIAANRYIANFFGGGGHTTKIIKADQELTPAQAAAIKASYVAATSGRAPAVFGSGLDIETVQDSPSDTDFLNLLRFAVEQACRVFGVPPSMVYATMSGQNVTYANVTDSDLQFLKHSLGIWLSDIEDALSMFSANGQFVKFNVDALLRVTPKDRHAIYERRLRSKTMTVDEVRILEDEEPFGGEFAEPGIPGTFEPVPMDDEGAAADEA